MKKQSINNGELRRELRRRRRVDGLVAMLDNESVCNFHVAGRNFKCNHQACGNFSFRLEIPNVNCSG
jgi:hypothetical protein